MFKGTNIKPYLGYSFAAALLYSLPVIIFLKDADYREAWLLYLGNFLFLAMIVFFIFRFNSRRDQNAGTMVMLTATSITTVLGTVMAVLIDLLLLLIFVPGILQAGTPDKILMEAPGNTVTDKTEGLVFMLLANAIIGNVSIGLFVSIIFPFTLKSDQTREKVPKRKQAEL
jgi:hypothetical protein